MWQKNIFDLTESKIKEAEPSLVLTGRKENVSIIAIKTDGKLNEIREIIKKNRGAYYSSESYLLGIFSSLTTKTFSNEIIAVRTGQEISTMLGKNNKKMKEKINYGIGINNGELILSKEEKIKFTAIGNTISLARKIAEIADNEFLVRENIRNKLANLKVEKTEKRGITAFKVKGIVEREKHEKFIQGFLKRQINNKQNEYPK